MDAIVTSAAFTLGAVTTGAGASVAFFARKASMAICSGVFLRIAAVGSVEGLLIVTSSKLNRAVAFPIVFSFFCLIVSLCAFLVL